MAGKRRCGIEIFLLPFSTFSMASPVTHTFPYTYFPLAAAVSTLLPLPCDPSRFQDHHGETAVLSFS